jgi:hypothetical protein
LGISDVSLEADVFQMLQEFDIKFTPKMQQDESHMAKTSEVKATTSSTSSSNKEDGSDAKVEPSKEKGIKKKKKSSMITSEVKKAKKSNKMKEL